MIYHFAYIGVALIGLALIASWMFIVSRRHVLTRVIGCGAAMILALCVWTNITAILGYAVPAQPAGKVQVVAFVDDHIHGKIYLWLREADGPRAYVVPYSEGLANGLIQAKKQASDGSRIMLAPDGNGRAVSRLKGGDHDGQRFHVEIEPTLPPKS